MLDKINLTKFFEGTLEYPKEYNPRIHGPYNPSVYYGKADPFGDVKVGEIGNWLNRRDKSLKSIGSAVSRAFWRYKMKYITPKKAGPTVIYHFIAISFIANYFIREYSYRSKNGWAKYH